MRDIRDEFTELGGRVREHLATHIGKAAAVVDKAGR
jgi:hypothetical protein